jgi:hypothetical protein
MLFESGVGRWIVEFDFVDGGFVDRRFLSGRLRRGNGWEQLGGPLELPARLSFARREKAPRLVASAARKGRPTVYDHRSPIHVQGAL